MVVGLGEHEARILCCYAGACFLRRFHQRIQGGASEAERYGELEKQLEDN